MPTLTVLACAPAGRKKSPNPGKIRLSGFFACGRCDACVALTAMRWRAPVAPPNAFEQNGDHLIAALQIAWIVPSNSLRLQANMDGQRRLGRSAAGS
jgi:hypothetical protein